MASLGQLGGFLHGLTQGIQSQREYKLKQSALENRKESLAMEADRLQASLDSIERENERFNEERERDERNDRLRGLEFEARSVDEKLAEVEGEINSARAAGGPDVAAQIERERRLPLLEEKDRITQRRKAIFQGNVAVPDFKDATLEGAKTTAKNIAGSGGGAQSTEPSKGSSSQSTEGQPPSDPVMSTQDVDRAVQTGIDITGKTRTELEQLIQERWQSRTNEVLEEFHTEGTYQRIAEALSGDASTDTHDSAPILLVKDLMEKTEETQSQTFSQSQGSRQGGTKEKPTGGLSGSTREGGTTTQKFRPVFDEVKLEAQKRAASEVRRILRDKKMAGEFPEEVIQQIAESVRVKSQAGLADAEKEDREQGYRSFGPGTIEGTRVRGQALPGEAEPFLQGILGGDSPIGLEAVLANPQTGETAVINALEADAIQAMLDAGWKAQYQFNFAEKWGDGAPEAVVAYLATMRHKEGRIPNNMEVPIATELLPELFQQVAEVDDNMISDGFQSHRVDFFNEDVHPGYMGEAITMRDYLKTRVSRFVWDRLRDGDYAKEYRESTPKEVSEDLVNTLETEGLVDENVRLGKGVLGPDLPLAKGKKFHDQGVVNRKVQILSRATGHFTPEFLEQVPQRQKQELLTYLAKNEAALTKRSDVAMAGEGIADTRDSQDPGLKRLVDDLRKNIRTSLRGNIGVPTAPGPVSEDKELQSLLNKVNPPVNSTEEIQQTMERLSTLPGVRGR